MKKQLAILSTILMTIVLHSNTVAQERFIELKNKKQFVIIQGDGDPTIVFVTGLGQTYDSFKPVYDEIKKTNRVFLYDRAGLGKSESLNNSRTVDTMAYELNELLIIENIEGPIILVGHSMGGFILRTLSAMYPDKVAGLIFIDASYEEEFVEGCKVRDGNDKFEYIKEFRSYIHEDGAPKGYNDELLYCFDYDSIGYSTNAKIVKPLKLPSNIPITVFVSTKINIDDPFSKQESKSALTFFQNWKSKNSKIKLITTSKSGHFIQLEEPSLIIESINEMVKEIKSH